MKKFFAVVFRAFHIILPSILLVILVFQYLGIIYIEWEVLLIPTVMIFPWSILIFFMFSRPLMKASRLSFSEDMWGWPYPKGMNVLQVNELIWWSVCDRKRFRAFLLRRSHSFSAENAFEYSRDASREATQEDSRAWREYR